MGFQRKDLLGLEDLHREEIQHILDSAESFREINLRPIKKVPTLRGKTIIHLFYEPSTRTKMSFDIAGKRLSADTYSIAAKTSSVLKGETLLDTVLNLRAMNPDAIVIRHSASGTPHWLAKQLDISIINAGDGMHEHPTQALLDMLTIRQRKGHLEGLTVAIIGDIFHSRVARSNIWGLNKMGAKVILCGPPTMIPLGIETMGVQVTFDVHEAITQADVIMVLRIQKERQGQILLPSLREYSQIFGIDLKKLSYAKPDVLIMHPGPMNRGVEISPEVADGPYSVILDQVNNGVAVRMAILYLLIGVSKTPPEDSDTILDGKEVG